MNVLVMIMARKGSRRLPGRNNMTFAGKPVLAYTYEHIKESKFVNRTILCTDDPDLIVTAKNLGIEVEPLPPELGADGVESTFALKHVYQKICKRENYKADLIVELLPLPLRPKDCIDVCIGEMLRKDADSVATVAPCKHITDLDDDNFIQETPKRKYYYTAAVFVYRHDLLLKGIGADAGYDYAGKNRLGVVCNPHDCVDIDTKDDVDWANFVFQTRIQNDSTET